MLRRTLAFLWRFFAVASADDLRRVEGELHALEAAVDGLRAEVTALERELAESGGERTIRIHHEPPRH